MTAKPFRTGLSLLICSILLTACQRPPAEPAAAPASAPAADQATPPAAPAPAPAAAPAAAPTPVPGATVVTPDNFIRAESDTYMANLAKEAGGIGKLFHHREPASVDHQTVIRLNRDTLYSSAVFDLDAGPVTVTLPDAGTRFQSLQVINQDHYAWTEYGAGPHRITRDKAGTRYVVVGVRTLVDPNDAADVGQVHALQDAITVAQPGGPGTLELPSWDPASQKKVRDALLALGATQAGFKGAFGQKGQVDPVNHLIGTAAGWGGNPDKDATYLGFTPPRNDGATVYQLAVGKVPVDAFWSVSVYGPDGYFAKNDRNAYSINSITGHKEADGSVRIQFGGCDGQIPNCIPTPPGWNYTVRLYRPQASILDGSWKFPEPQPM
ncbi:DUF1254 domain-containing protein [Stenotrophomonas panacihumi]|uniref:DUF1254 domain-containing protein n=1 Tax=Stenotrophomonas panacihumi TaxID=676599 RepID=UPI000D378CDA|nr:DUF1254 domain-containing protein [Stenotrophomonas panacihumi]PTN54570.1 carboxylesterase [Stenotrophomonas panacihumi]